MLSFKQDHNEAWFSYLKELFQRKGSQACRTLLAGCNRGRGRLRFCLWPNPYDPKTSKLVEGGIEAQAVQVLENLRTILESINLTLNDVVKTSVFLSSFGDFQSFNRVYSRYFEVNSPARTTVQAGLMFEVLVEIDAVTKKS
jgi:2-iminobutanoate/2-iminopropanoate deaminase